MLSISLQNRNKYIRKQNCVFYSNQLRLFILLKYSFKKLHRHYTTNLKSRNQQSFCVLNNNLAKQLLYQIKHLKYSNLQLKKHFFRYLRGYVIEKNISKKFKILVFPLKTYIESILYIVKLGYLKNLMC